ncbi:MAG TPA: Trk family potassium uptake protein [Clostridiales bacterium UBA8153]|nr:Trk family potassium uptake protein [Clostridiales bacterium UBA8153]
MSFLAVIGLGTLLLLLPWSTAPGRDTSWVDALFTATSAVCVTGLTVVPTGTHWSAFGQLVILALIQVGGLGIMTTAAIFAVLTGRRIGLKDRLVIRESFGKDGLAGLVRLLRLVVFTTAAVQLLGAMYLAWRFAGHMPVGQAWYYALFHTVAAFNNAGFDLFGDSLMRYVSDPWINFGFIALIITGGLGFPVLMDLYQRARDRKHRLTLHTRMVVATTTVLLVAGALLVVVLEYGNPATLGRLDLRGRLLAGLFQSVTPRTAGFNTLPTYQLRPVTLLFIMVLMFVGASPGGTGGGIKTTTFVSLLASVWTLIAGRQDIEMFRTRLSREVLEKSLAIFLVGLTLVTVTAGFLLASEGLGFLPVLFESFSAFGTVGLSLGITSGLSTAGRLMLSFTMFAGRVGPLTVFMAIAIGSRSPAAYRRPEEKIMVG